MQLSLDFDLDQIIEVSNKAKIGGFATIESYILSLVGKDVVVKNDGKDLVELSADEISNIINNHIFKLTPDALYPKPDGYRLKDLYNFIASDNDIPDWGDLTTHCKIQVGKLFNNAVTFSTHSIFTANQNKKFSNSFLYQFKNKENGNDSQ